MTTNILKEKLNLLIHRLSACVELTGHCQTDEHKRNVARGVIIDLNNFIKLSLQYNNTLNTKAGINGVKIKNERKRIRGLILTVKKKLEKFERERLCAHHQSSGLIELLNEWNNLNAETLENFLAEINIIATGLNLHQINIIKFTSIILNKEVEAPIMLSPDRLHGARGNTIRYIPCGVLQEKSALVSTIIRFIIQNNGLINKDKIPIIPAKKGSLSLHCSILCLLFSDGISLFDNLFIDSDKNGESLLNIWNRSNITGYPMLRTVYDMSDENLWNYAREARNIFAAHLDERPDVDMRIILKSIFNDNLSDWLSDLLLLIENYKKCCMSDIRTQFYSIDECMLKGVSKTNRDMEHVTSFAHPGE